MSFANDVRLVGYCADKAILSKTKSLNPTPHKGYRGFFDGYEST